MKKTIKIMDIYITEDDAIDFVMYMLKHNISLKSRKFVPDDGIHIKYWLKDFPDKNRAVCSLYMEEGRLYIRITRVSFKPNDSISLKDSIEKLNNIQTEIIL